MSVFWGIIGFAGAVLVLLLALVGAWGFAKALTGDDDSRAAARRAREAERQIADIGRQAQVTIMSEALRRVLLTRHQASSTTSGHGQAQWPGEGRRE